MEHLIGNVGEIEVAAGVGGEEVGGEAEAARVRDRRDDFLPRAESEVSGFLAPPLHYFASGVELHDFAHAIGDKNCADAIEDDSGGDEASPGFEVAAFGIEDLEALVVAVADVHTAVGTDGNGMRQIELARFRAFFTPGLEELAAV